MPLLVGALFCFVCVYPGFHIGLCPHFTLGFAGVPCLKALVISLNFDVLALILGKYSLSIITQRVPYNAMVSFNEARRVKVNTFFCFFADYEILYVPLLS